MTGIETVACWPTIRNADDLEVWRDRLSGDRHGVAAIVDDHGRPRLMTEGENGKMYVTATGGEEGEEPWDPAEMELWAYGPFAVIHPPVSLPPWPGDGIEEGYQASLAAIIRLGDLRKDGIITEADEQVLRAGLDAGPSLLIDNVKLRVALAARNVLTTGPAEPSTIETEWWVASCGSGHLSHHLAVAGVNRPTNCRCGEPVGTERHPWLKTGSDRG